MFIANDTHQERVVSGLEADIDQPNYVDDRHRFRCPNCGERLSYVANPCDDLGYFTHENGISCVNDGNMSDYHRLAEEVITKELINGLALNPAEANVDIEGRIGSEKNFVIVDVCMRAPIKLAVEVIHSHTSVLSPRRLQTIAEAGYALSYVQVKTGSARPIVEGDSVDIGYFSPYTHRISWGDILGVEQLYQITRENNEAKNVEGLISA